MRIESSYVNANLLGLLACPSYFVLYAALRIEAGILDNNVQNRTQVFSFFTYGEKKKSFSFVSKTLGFPFVSCRFYDTIDK